MSNDQNNKLTKPNNLNDPLKQQNGLSSPALIRRIGGVGVAGRVAAQSLREANGESNFPAPERAKHRICLVLDCSGSMATMYPDPWTQPIESRSFNSQGQPNPTSHIAPKARIGWLKDAVMNFATSCDWAETSVAIETFGYRGDSRNNEISRPLTQHQGLILAQAAALSAYGSTPMGAALERALTLPITRAVVISDGCATDEPKSSEVALQYKEAGIIIDTVSIGDDKSGEALLRKLAELTNGVFVKFTDVSKFSTALKYLTPGLRPALLTTSLEGEAAVKRLIGADSIESKGR